MILAKDITGNPVIGVNSGQQIGRLKDLYLSPDCQTVVGIYLGTEGLLSRQSFLVQSEDIVTFGPDAVLVKHDEVIHEASEVSAAEGWLRRDDLQGRPVDTPGGTKVGKVGDIILDRNGQILGFSLGQTYVDGPVAENRAIALHTVQDTGTEDGVMTVDLERAERQQLSVS